MTKGKKKSKIKTLNKKIKKKHTLLLKNVGRCVLLKKL